MSKIQNIERSMDAALQGEDVDKLLAALSEDERTLWWEMAAELRSNPTSDSLIANELWKVDYIRKPPTMNEFIEDEFYLGKVLTKSEDSEGLFPAWKELLVKDFNLDSRVHQLVITGSLGTGKCWSPGTYIVMSDGRLKKVEDIEVGDTVLDDESKGQVVLSTTKGRSKMYTIHPARGEPFTVNGDHILVLKSTGSDDISEVSVNDFLKWPRERKHKACLYRVPVDWPENSVPIDPYILGLWLGDGSTMQTILTSADEELYTAWILYGKSLGLTWNAYSSGKGSKAKSYQLSARDIDGKIQKGKNELKTRLRSLGLLSSEKFIPHSYLANSRKNRLELLAGLIDTDGSKSKTSGEGGYEITLKPKHLSSQVKFLAQSLGYCVTTSIKIVNSEAYYKNIISGADDIPVRLERKKCSGIVSRTQISNLTETLCHKDNRKTRFAVIPVDEGAYYGFTLSGSGRCLLRDFTVTHNTYVAVGIILYRIVIATLLRNPQVYFGLGKGSKIIYNTLSVTKAAVAETAFGDAQNFMANSPFFLEHCGFNPDIQYTNFRIPLRNGICLTAGSKGQHLLGRNVVAVLLDEGNWRLEKDADTTAYDLYGEVRDRINNRFRKLAGFLPAISILASSAKDESSFTEKVISEIQQTNDPSTQLVYRKAVYKIKRHTLRLGERWFKVAYGIKNMDPVVMDGFYKEDGTPLDVPGKKHEEAPKGASVELVPDIYFDEFRRRPRVNLQSVCGISTGGSHRLFTSMLDFERCVENAEKSGLTSPVIGNIEYIPMSTEDNKNIWDYLDHKKFLTRVASQIQPLRHPNSLRYAHLDLAKTTMAGLSICHLVGNQLVEGLVRDGQPFSEYRLTVEYDFILTIIAGNVKHISLEKIQNFFFWLRDKCGFRFGLVTADQYQSELGLQMMESRGFKVDELSLDRDKTQYYAWKMAVDELRIRPYRNRHLMDEAEKLMDGDKKIDHPKDGTKDTTDSCAGAYFNAISSDEKETIGIENVPTIHTNTALEAQIKEPAPITINLPNGYTRLVRFKA